MKRIVTAGVVQSFWSLGTKNLGVGPKTVGRWKEPWTRRPGSSTHSPTHSLHDHLGLQPSLPQASPVSFSLVLTHCNTSALLWLVLWLPISPATQYVSPLYWGEGSHHPHPLIRPHHTALSLFLSCLPSVWESCPKARTGLILLCTQHLAQHQYSVGFNGMAGSSHEAVALCSMNFRYPPL